MSLLEVRGLTTGREASWARTGALRGHVDGYDIGPSSATTLIASTSRWAPPR